MSVTKAKRHGANAGGPQLGYDSLNDGSVKITPSSSRMRMKRLPFGKAAWATRTVSSGIGSTDIGRSDMDPSVHESFASTAPPAEFANSVNTDAPRRPTRSPV